MINISSSGNIQGNVVFIFDTLVLFYYVSKAFVYGKSTESEDLQQRGMTHLAQNKIRLN